MHILIGWYNIENMELNSFAAFFHQKRTQLGLTQKDIAESLCYSIQIVSNWEGGKAFPNLAVFGTIAKLFKGDFNSLINLEDKKENDIADNNSFNQESFAASLRMLRKIYDYSQKELAEKIKTNYQTIIAFEKGTGVPTINQFLELCSI